MLPSLPHQVSRRWRRAFATSSSGTPFYGLPREQSRDQTHQPSLLSNLRVAVNSATTAFADPTRADAVAALGEVTGYVALQRLHEKMKQDDTGLRILRERPVVSKETLPIDELIASASHDEGRTFGQAYGAFLQGHGFDPDERDEVKYIQDPDLAYIMLRYRQCHDFWHVLTGLPPSVLGELGLKWLELFQTGLPVAALSATVGSMKLEQQELVVLNNYYIPWAIRTNEKGTNLMTVYYEEEFDTPLSELRARLRLETAPGHENQDS